MQGLELRVFLLGGVPTSILWYGFRGQESVRSAYLGDPSGVTPRSDAGPGNSAFSGEYRNILHDLRFQVQASSGESLSSPRAA
jgi:hypothetical protein